MLLVCQTHEAEILCDSRLKQWVHFSSKRRDNQNQSCVNDSITAWCILVTKDKRNYHRIFRQKDEWSKNSRPRSCTVTWEIHHYMHFLIYVALLYDILTCMSLFLPLPSHRWKDILDWYHCLFFFFFPSWVCVRKVAMIIFNFRSIHCSWFRLCHSFLWTQFSRSFL